MWIIFQAATPPPPPVYTDICKLLKTPPSAVTVYSGYHSWKRIRPDVYIQWGSITSQNLFEPSSIRSSAPVPIRLNMKVVTGCELNWIQHEFVAADLITIYYASPIPWALAEYGEVQSMIVTAWLGNNFNQGTSASENFWRRPNLPKFN